jgi:hypothetical protein
MIGKELTFDHDIDRVYLRWVKMSAQNESKRTYHYPPLKESLECRRH